MICMSSSVFGGFIRKLNLEGSISNMNVGFEIRSYFNRRKSYVSDTTRQFWEMREGYYLQKEYSWATKGLSTASKAEPDYWE